MIKIVLYLLLSTPVYLWFLRTLRNLSQQKSEAIRPIPRGASQS
jgi:hypothetical protein